MKYERLTQRDQYGRAILKNEKVNKDIAELKLNFSTVLVLDKIVSHFCELEDKIEAGTLVELPCKVGTKIYIVGESDFCIPKYQMWEDEFCLEDIERFGDTVFTTKAEAEKRLEELRGER